MKLFFAAIHKSQESGQLWFDVKKQVELIDGPRVVWVPCLMFSYGLFSSNTITSTGWVRSTY